MDSQPLLRGADVVLAVAQGGDEGQVQGGEKTLQVAEHAGVGAHPVGDHSDFHPGGAGLAHQQQILDEVGGGVDVDGRRQHGHQDGVHPAHVIRQLQAGHPGGGVDDEALGLWRQAHLPALGDAVALLEGGDAVDGRALAVAQAQPAHAGALRVVVQQGRHLPLCGIVGGQVGGEGGLAATALGVEDQDSMHGHLVSDGGENGPHLT